MITVRNRAHFDDLFWGPWGEIERLQHDLENLFSSHPVSPRRRGQQLALNAFADKEQAVVQLAVPGFERNDVSGSLEGKTLTISGQRAETGKDYRHREFGAGEFTRTVQLPFSVSNEAVSAELKDGILQVTLPRAESDKPRQIQISN